MELDRNGLRVLGESDCVELLETSRIGRVGLSLRALPTIMPVMYEVEGAAITFHVSGGVLAAAARRGDIVCFEADSVDLVERQLWSVVVVGRLEVAPAEARHGGAVGEARFGVERVVLPMTIVSGRAGSSVVTTTGCD